MSRSPSSFFSQKKTRILFYQTGMQGWIKVNVLVFKTFIDILYPDLAEKLEWLLPVQDAMSDAELLRHIKQNNVDILCTSHYLWNHEALTSQLSRIKSRLTLQAIIAGGPSIDVNNNKDFFDQHPYIDYAVYGAGEQAFADIVSHLVLETPMIAFNTSNCGWKNPNTGLPIVADYKFVKMLETSPFVHNAKLFGRMVADAKKKNVTDILEWVPYTLTRGCPYACTFCDWNSGLGNKVSRRKNTYQQEIDLFQKLNLKNIYLSDANVGQYDEDVDMIEYFAQKNLQENAGFRISGNYSKLNKKNNLKMFSIMAESGLVQKTLNFSIQDINEQVLKNIDRPDVGWDTHVAMADELREKHPHLIVKTQLICGLPGQTVESWRQTMQQIVANNMLPVWFVNEPLPASPAIYDPEYQKKWEFEYDKVNRIDLQGNHYIGIVPKKCVSFSQRDLVEMFILSGTVEAISLINLTMIQHVGSRINTEFIIDNLLSSKGYRILCDNLYNNWANDQKFYLTQDFVGNAETSYSCEVGFLSWTLMKHKTFMLQIQNLLLENQKEQLSYLVDKEILFDYLLELYHELA
jgi:radical SAM superfamily enzyme YgiQ (UPF0313 family)